MKAGKIVVTGASGFVGSCVVEALFVRGGCEIIPTARRLHAGARVARFGCQLKPADLTLRPEVEALVAGAQAVVHCAFGGDSDQEQATLCLLEAAVAAGIHTFIHISTTEVYADQRGTLTESAPLRAAGDDYGAIKARIDQLVQSWADRFPRLIILRPGIIYGPLSDAWTITPIQRFAKGWNPRTEEMQGVGAFLHIADLCRIIADLLARDGSGLRVYNVVGPEIASWADYFERLGQALNVTVARSTRGTGDQAEISAVRALLRALPTGLRRKLVRLATAFPSGARLIGRWRRLHRVEPVSGEKELFARNVRYSIQRLVDDGLAPEVSLAAGIEQSASWARMIGLA